jgi:hypothetical protein
MATQQQYKGPRKYEHGADSTFALAAFSVQGKWTTIYSRSRPGSRSNKVFTDEWIGTEETEKVSKIKVFPNPASEVLTINNPIGEYI